jgi:hypothetical protein
LECRCARVQDSGGREEEEREREREEEREEGAKRESAKERERAWPGIVGVQFTAQDGGI